MGQGRAEFTESIIEAVLDGKRLRQEQINKLNETQAKTLLMLYQDELIKAKEERQSHTPSKTREIANCTSSAVSDVCIEKREEVSRSSAPEIFVSEYRISTLPAPPNMDSSDKTGILDIEKTGRASSPSFLSVDIKELRQIFIDHEKPDTKTDAVDSNVVDSNVVDSNVVKEKAVYPKSLDMGESAEKKNPKKNETELLNKAPSILLKPKIEEDFEDTKGKNNRDISKQALSKINLYALVHCKEIEKKYLYWKVRQNITSAKRIKDATKFFCWTIPNETFHFIKGVVYNNADRDYNDLLTLQKKQKEEAEDNYQITIRAAWIEAIAELVKSDLDFAKYILDTDIEDAKLHSKVQKLLRLKVIWAKVQLDKQLIKIDEYFNSKTYQESLDYFKEKSFYLRGKLAIADKLKNREEKKKNFQNREKSWFTKRINLILDKLDIKKRKITKWWKGSVVDEAKYYLTSFPKKTSNKFKKVRKTHGKTGMAVLTATSLALVSGILLESDNSVSNSTQTMAVNPNDYQSPVNKPVLKLTSGKKSITGKPQVNKPTINKPSQRRQPVFFRLSDLENGLPAESVPLSEVINKGR